MNPLTTIAVMTSGSHLYGTTVPGSDHDRLAVHLPSGRAILLGRPEETVQTGTKAEIGIGEGGVGGAWMRATRPGETDRESHALGKFFAMLRGGQMMAVEMLFVPQDQVLATDPIWDEVRQQRDRLLCRKASSFAGHARKQAEIYGRKARRLGEVETAHETLTALIARYGGDTTLGAVAAEIETLVAGREHLAVVPQDSGYTASLPHLVVADRRIAYTLSLTAARRIVDARLRTYGARARAALDGHDWKSISHAVRIGHQAIELLTTGALTFPRPEAGLLRSIRLGEHSIEAVGETLDRILDEVERVAPSSSLPEGPDEATMDAIQCAAYARQIAAN